MLCCRIDGGVVADFPGRSRGHGPSAPLSVISWVVVFCSCLIDSGWTVDGLFLG